MTFNEGWTDGWEYERARQVGDTISLPVFDEDEPTDDYEEGWDRGTVAARLAYYEERIT